MISPSGFLRTRPVLCLSCPRDKCLAGTVQALPAESSATAKAAPLPLAGSFQALEVTKTLRDNGDRDISQRPSQTIRKRTQRFLLGGFLLNQVAEMRGR
jgi:hypothetical protein